MTRISGVLSVVASMLLAQSAASAQVPQVQRHELMEDVGAAAKQIGRMLEGETSFDAARAMNSFRTWRDAAAVVGDLFPPGSESGYDTRARATIWSDRMGFDQALQAWAIAVDDAIAANPQDLEALQAAAGPVFKACKGCHEEYRLEED